MKYCPGCKTDKPLDTFWRDKSRPDGLNSYCKECAKERSKKQWETYYPSNKERLIDAVKRRRGEAKTT